MGRFRSCLDSMAAHVLGWDKKKFSSVKQFMKYQCVRRVWKGLGLFGFYKIIMVDFLFNFSRLIDGLAK